MKLTLVYIGILYLSPRSKKFESFARVCMSDIFYRHDESAEINTNEYPSDNGMDEELL